MRLLPFFLLVVAFLVGPAAMTAAEEASRCLPTPADALGPFYQPGAPVRSAVGEGYLLQGRVLAAPDCQPLPGARIELWLAGPNGHYDDAHRATLYAGAQGEYQFSSNFPPPYSGRPPHIHLRVTAPRHRELITQHYPQPGTRTGRFDLVLPPAAPGGQR